MDIYNYHSDTKEYISKTVAVPSPLEPGVYLVPACASTLAPPEPQEGMAIVFEGDAWGLVEDHRGLVIYSVTTAASMIMADLGAVPQGFTALLPPAKFPVWTGSAWAQSLVEAQKTQQILLQNSYQATITGSITFTTSGGVTQVFQADEDSRRNISDQLSAYQVLGHAPDGFYWLAADNTPVPFTLTDLENVWAQANVQGFQAFAHLQTKKSAVRAATTVLAVQAITW